MSKRSPGAGQFARLEREQRWLLAAVPEQAQPRSEILDRYLHGTRLRLHRVTLPDRVIYKLGQKVRLIERHSREALRMAPTLHDALTSARSGNLHERIDAAGSLVAWIGDEQADAALLRLLDDPDDTAPVLAAAEALLACATPAALRVFALGWDQADDQCGNWMADALRWALSTGSLEQGFEILLTNENEGVRDGARSILDWIHP